MDVASVAACFLTGGTGAVVGILSKIMGYSGEFYELRKKLEKISRNPKYKNDNDAMIWAMTQECLLAGGTHIAKKFTSEQGSKYIQEICNNLGVAISKEGADVVTGTGMLGEGIFMPNNTNTENDIFDIH